MIRRLHLQRWIIFAGLLLFATLSNHWSGWEEGIERLGEGDVGSYEVIAAAAPSFPSEALGSAFSQRFVVHYATGLVADLSGLRLTVAYRIVWVTCLALILLVVHLLLSRLRLSTFAYGLCAALIILNPFALRPYAIVPGMVQDLVFVLGLAVLLFGLVEGRLGLLFLGGIVAVLGRQTALFVAPAVGLWVLGVGVWRGRQTWPRLLAYGGLVAVTAALYLAIRRVTGPFSILYEPSIPQDTVLALLPSLPGSLEALASHALRVAAPLLTPAVLLVLLTWPLAREGGLARSVPRECWASLLLAGAIVVQPLAISPEFPGFASNEQRTSALGLVPLVIALAFVFERLERSRRLRLTPAATVAVFTLLGLASLHHVFTIIGPANLAQFIVLQFGTMTLVGAIVLQGFREGLHPGGRHELGRARA